MSLPPDDLESHQDDEIIASIRRFRTEYAQRFNFDLDLIVEDLQRQERESGVRTVVRSPRRPASPSEEAA